MVMVEPVALDVAVDWDMGGCGATGGALCGLEHGLKVSWTIDGNEGKEEQRREEAILFQNQIPRSFFMLVSVHCRDPGWHPLVTSSIPSFNRLRSSSSG